MDIKNFLSKKEENEEQEYLWSLIIEPGWLQVGIWRIYQEKVQVVYSSIPVAWEFEADLTSVADSALSVAIQNFPENLSEPTKTVLGVVPSWIENGKIKEEFLDSLKKLYGELSLRPIGFVVISEAISHLIKSEEGSPLSAILLGIYKDVIEVSVFSLGNLLGNTKVSRSISLVDDVVEGLSRFSQISGMPSRFLVYNGREAELEDARQQLHNANWEDYEEIKFLHMPKIEIVGLEQKIEAISFAGASELTNVSAVTLMTDVKEMENLKRDLTVEESGDRGGYIPDFISPESAGFVVGEDVKKSTPPVKEEVVDAQQGESEDGSFDRFDNLELLEEKNIAQSDKQKIIFRPWPLVKAKLASLIFGFNFVGKFANAGKKSFILGLTFLALLFLTGFVFWWFYPKADLIVYVSSRSLSEDFTITANSLRESSDLEKKILAARILETEVISEKTKSTSGTKTVGEKAKGEVTIYRVGTEINLSSGTVLTGPGNLKFTLDEDVRIASGSAGTPGKTQASVTAQDIGAEYNLASGANFSVDDFSLSDLEAKNEESFSGGSSREISAVSKEDQDSLFEDLQKEMISNAQDELLKKVKDSEILIKESFTATPASQIFSSKIGDEAESLKLELGLKIKALSVNKDELIEIAYNTLKDKTPAGFILRKEQLGIDFDLAGSGEAYTFEVFVKANLLPQVDTVELTKKIRGKYPEVVQEFLPKEVPGFVRAEIKMRPSFPGRLGTLPRIVKNINIEVAAER